MSVSCPTAEMVGTRTAASARHTASALNAERSSRPPPPRPTMQHSISAIRFTNPSARTSASTALPPCTRASTTSRRAEGHRRRATVMMSCSAAPSVLVTTATVPASGGSARFRAASNSPSWCSSGLDPLELPLRLADRRGGKQAGDVELELALRLVQARPPQHEDLGAVGRGLAGAHRVALPHAAAHLAVRVAELEVPVPALPRLALEYFAADPDGRELALDHALGRQGELADGPHVIGGGEEVGLEGEGHVRPAVRRKESPMGGAVAIRPGRPTACLG